MPNLPNTLFLAISLSLFLSHFISKLAMKLGQPKVLGEITVGLVLGPSLFGYLFPDLFAQVFTQPNVTKLNLIKDLGLIMLMFCSGYELRSLNLRKNIKACFYGLLVGIGIPVILGTVFLNFVDVSMFVGPQGFQTNLKAILLLSMAVTSIPVISRILMDLNLLKSQFAQMILSIALVEDIILYAFFNVILTSNNEVNTHSFLLSVVSHVLISGSFLLFIIFGRNKLYQLSRKFVRDNNLERYQYASLILATVFMMVFLFNLIGIVNMISAFACGIIVGSGTSERAQDIAELIKRFSFAIFIPLYFVMVGFNINLAADFSLPWLLIFFTASSVFKILGGFLVGKCSGFPNFKSLATGLTLNARGGPGIVIALTSYEAGLINSTLFTTLILTALLTSSFAGMFLKHNKASVEAF